MGPSRESSLIGSRILGRLEKVSSKGRVRLYSREKNRIPKGKEILPPGHRSNAQARSQE